MGRASVGTETRAAKPTLELTSCWRLYADPHIKNSGVPVLGGPETFMTFILGGPTSEGGERPSRASGWAVGWGGDTAILKHTQSTPFSTRPYLSGNCFTRASPTGVSPLAPTLNPH